jgi:hypothetical protein
MGFLEIEDDYGEKYLTITQRKDAYAELINEFQGDRDLVKKAKIENIIFSLRATSNSRNRFTDDVVFNEMKEEIKEYLDEKRKETVNPIHKSRYCDILWDFWKVPTAGIQAIPAYTESARVHLKNNNLTEAEDAIQRAIGLTHGLKREEYIESIKVVAFDFLSQTNSHLKKISTVKSSLYSLKKFLGDNFIEEVDGFLEGLQETEKVRIEHVEEQKTLREKAELHTPEELLMNAQDFLESDNEAMLRACVLEAITALEAYVQKVVFDVFNEQFPDILVKWIKEKTMMDFDTRISTLTSVALGQQIDKNDTLWSNYKVAKGIRNDVTHSGRKVTKKDASFVIQTVYDWLSFLGSTAEVDLSLYSLKNYIEKKNITPSSEKEAVNLVAKFYRETKAASSDNETTKLPIVVRPDLILHFGKYKILIETKLLKGSIESVERNKSTYLYQVNELLSKTMIERAALIIFCKGNLPEVYNKIQLYSDGKIKVIYIQAKS